MTSRCIRTEFDRDRLLTYLKGLKLPFVNETRLGEKRSNRQNRLNRTWCREISEQLGDVTAEWVRGFSKAKFGVPILMSENEIFREKFLGVVKHLTYEQKIDLMCEPLDMPVTRLMTVAQETRYLDEMHRYWTAERGMVLTDPDPFVGKREEAA